MKRPLAVSGLVYLTVLTVVFYFRTPAVMLAVTAAATLMVCAVLVLRHFKPLPVAALVAAGVSALLAVLSIFLYQNFTVQPLLDRYTGRAVRVEGYLGDLITENKRGKTYIIHTETIDGAPCSAKISYTVFSKKDWEPFDKLCVTVTPKVSTYSYSLSRGIYLRAAESKKADLVMTGEKHRSFYASAVALRLEMQKILDNYLDDNAQSLASAVLLGEKNALEPDVRDAFSDTGMSYLVVVSGMHLAIITMLLKKLLKPRFGAKGILRMILITAFVLLFAAVTGFTPSVVRAAVMMLFIVAAPLFRRESDSVNALGAAALVLGIVKGYDDPADHEAKKQHYARVREFAERFKTKDMSINCRELLTLAGLMPESGGEPEQRTEEFYRKRPCPHLVYDAARILDEMLGTGNE